MVTIASKAKRLSPYLTERLYKRIKKVVGQPIALVDQRGLPLPEANDFSDFGNFEFEQPPSQARPTVALTNADGLQAIPIYWEDKFYFAIICQIAETDSQLVSVLISLAELLIQQFIDEYRPRPDAVDLLTTRLVYRPSSLDQDELAYQLEALGHRLDVARAAIIVELTGFWDNYLQVAGEPLNERKDLIEAKKRDLLSGFHNFFTKSQDSLVGYLGKDLFLLLKDLPNGELDHLGSLLVKNHRQITGPLKNVYIKQVTIAIGTLAAKPSELIISASRASQAFRIGRQLYGNDQVFQYSQMGVLPLLLVGEESTKHKFGLDLARQLEDKELVDTLAAFLRSNLNLTQAARSMGVHRNTIIYRLNRINEITGKDLRSFPVAVEFYLANLWRDYFS